MNLSILEPGLSFIIRSKNEEENTLNCLESLKPIYENNDKIEIIFVDNMSTDNTLSIAEKFSEKYSNVKTYSYDHVVPRCGSEHQESVLNMCSNTLATYYNWCLNKATKYNVIKWDGDFVANLNNLKTMIKEYDLENRSDHFALWCTGETIFINEDQYYKKKDSFYDEFRVFSKINGFVWENTPDGKCETSSIEYMTKIPDLPHNNKEYCDIYGNYIKSITNFNQCDFDNFLIEHNYSGDNPNEKHRIREAYVKSISTFNDNYFLNYISNNGLNYISNRVTTDPDEEKNLNSLKYFKMDNRNITHRRIVSKKGISYIPGFTYVFDEPVFYEIKRTSKDEFASRSDLIDVRDNDDKHILNDLQNNIIGDKIIKTNAIF
jgi:glycosyltransferase involved in cell wall biosynthesis